MARLDGTPRLTKMVTVPDGHGGTRTVPLWERIVENVRATGMDIGVCANRAGVDRNTLAGWLRSGEACLQRYGEGKRLSPGETAYAEFVLNINEAAADWETRNNVLLEQLAQGNIPQRIVTERREVIVNTEGVVIGEEVTTTTRTTSTLPDAATIRWMLERKRRDRYSPQVAITGPDGGPLSSPDPQDLIAQIRAYKEGVEDGQARSVEVHENGVEAPGG